jgi:parallel beta-helix repeat protein
MTTLIPKFDLKNGGSIPTGAINRSIYDKLSDFVSVKDFGAVADGVITTGAGTDNTTAFQNAINALGAGGSLYIPQGIYKISSQITVPSNFTILGAGTYQSILLAPTAFNSNGLIKLNGAGGPPTTISNLAVLGQTGGTGASSIGINSIANGVILTNLWVSAFQTNVVLGSTDNFLLNSIIEYPNSNGLGISITSTDVTVSNCETYACYVGLSVSSVSYVDGTVTLNSIRSVACTYDGFAFTSSSNIQMSNCSVGHNNTSAYSRSAINIDTCSNITINNFIGRLGAQSSSAWGIHAVSSSKININNSQLSNWLYGIFIVSCDEVTIGSNICSNNYSRGIYAAATDKLIISNNCCDSNGTSGTTDAGIYSDNSSGYALHNIVGNICTQTGGGNQDYGIYANLTNNGASSGFTNIVGNMCKFNNTANISTNGLTANITSTGNVT